MKRNLLQLMIIAVLSLLLGCEQEKEPISVTGVTLSQKILEIVEGDTHTLTATVQPSNADNKTVSWTSTQSATASVKNGIVTAHKAGTATIIVTTTDGGKTAICEVTVKEKIFSVQSVSLNKTAMELTEGDEATLTATINPSNATNRNLTWTSSNNEVATVTDGKVSAVKIGKATITVTTEDGNKTASCEITVKEKVYPVESVSLDKSEMELTEGDEATLMATVNPSNASNKNVIWSSDKTSVATVADGKIIAVKAGIATITVKTEDGGKTATCKVTVKEKVYPVESISLDKTFVELMEGETLILSATITPHNATNKNMVWMSTDDSIASVDNKGKVTAIKEGTVIITVRTEDGDKTASCEINVLHDKSKDPIEFADEIMKEMCVSAFDTNGDGELSYKEASEVTSISKMTLTDKRFKSFDEFQYFTSVKTTPNSYFKGCIMMESITLPKETKSMGWYLFSGCEKLTSIVIPEGVTTIGYGTFSGCSSLTHINIPYSVTEIRGNAFSGCSSLTKVEIPDGVDFIEYSVFERCSSLINITLPEGILTIASSLFLGCSSLENINIPDSVNSIEADAFNGCSSLKKISIPSKVMYIPYRCFRDCISLAVVIIPEDVMKMGELAFDGCCSLSSIYVRASDPPKLYTNIHNRYDQFYNNAPYRKIYVPIESIDAYKTAEGWSEYADDIVGYDYENDKVVE